MPPAAPQHLLYARRLSTYVIELVPPRRMSRSAVESMRRDAEMLVHGASGAQIPFWFLDASRIDEFDPECLDSIHQAIEYGRLNLGLMGVAMVVPDTIMRTLVSQQVVSTNDVQVLVRATRKESLVDIGLMAA